MKNTCFWTLIPDSNRGEYILQLQDDRMLQMLNNKSLVILSLYDRGLLRLFSKLNIELFLEQQAAEKNFLAEIGSLEMKTVYIQTKTKNVRWNPALVYPFTALIQSSFTPDQLPIKIVFTNNQEKDHYLNKLNAATRIFVSKNIELWNEVNN